MSAVDSRSSRKLPTLFPSLFFTEWLDHRRESYMLKFNCLYCFYRSYILIIHAAIFLCCFYVFFFTFSHHSLAFLKSIVLKRIYIFFLLENERRTVEKTLYALKILKSVSANQFLIRLINDCKIALFNFEGL